MRPGLRRLEQDSVRLTPLDPRSPLAAEKRAVFEAGRSRHVVAGFDPAPALLALADRSGAGVMRRFAPADPPELAFEEDLAVLDGTTGTLPWLCVCVPSHWAPEEKLGLDFNALHGPVADNAALISASRRLVALVTAGECWERQVWTISPCGRYDQHPRRHARVAWPAADRPRSLCRAMLAAGRAPDFLSRRTRHAPSRVHDPGHITAPGRRDRGTLAGPPLARFAGLHVAGGAGVQEPDGRAHAPVALARGQGPERNVLMAAP